MKMLSGPYVSQESPGERSVCLFCSIPKPSWQKDCQNVFFQTQNDPDVLFHLCISSSYWKETCILHCKTLHFHKYEPYVLLLAFQCLEIILCSDLSITDQLFFVFYTES